MVDAVRRAAHRCGKSLKTLEVGSTDRLPSLEGRTVLVTGASRGIGRAIALRAAQDGARVVVTARSAGDGDPLLAVAAEIEAAGGEALAIAMDIRSDREIEAVVAAAVTRFGGLDALVNNAGALHRGSTLETGMSRVDLMFDVNLRGALAMTRACLPHLVRARNPHVLSIAPLLVVDPAERYASAPAFMISKFGLGLMTHALAAEFASAGVAFNALWPRLSIWGAARQAAGGDRLRSRRPEIMGDAAWHILTRDARAFTGRFTLDDDVLRDAGVTDFAPYYFEGADPADMHRVIQISHGLARVDP